MAAMSDPATPKSSSVPLAHSSLYRSMLATPSWTGMPATSQSSSRVFPDTTVSGSIQALPSAYEGHRRYAGDTLHGAFGLRVEDAVVDAAILGFVGGGHGDVQAAHRNGFVAEALAVDIEGQEGIEHEGADIVGVDLPGVSERCHAPACQNAEDVPVACVVDQAEGEHGRIAHVPIHHRLVVHVIAGGQHHALCGGELHIGAVFLLADGAGDGAVLFLDELHAGVS